MKLQRVLAIVSLLAAPAAEAQVCQFWVAPPPAGNDGNPGTSAQPWATLDHASARVLAQGASGATVCFRDGVYTGGNSLYERFTVLTTFRAENPYRAVLQNDSRAVSLFGARNLIFSGFEFRHTGPGAGAHWRGPAWARALALRMALSLRAAARRRSSQGLT